MYIPEEWKRYPFWVEPPHLGDYREYPRPPGPVADTDRPLSLKSDLTWTFHSITHPLTIQEQQLTYKLFISGLTRWKHKDTHGGMPEPSWQQLWRDPEYIALCKSYKEHQEWAKDQRRSKRCTSQRISRGNPEIESYVDGPDGSFSRPCDRCDISNGLILYFWIHG